MQFREFNSPQIHLLMFFIAYGWIHVINKYNIYNTYKMNQGVNVIFPLVGDFSDFLTSADKGRELSFFLVIVPLSPRAQERIY